VVPREGDSGRILEMLQEEADRLNRIVKDLLDFARPYEPSIKPVCIRTLISSAIELARCSTPRESCSLVTEIADGLPPFAADRHMLEQALINLVNNAMQAMPRGGKVTVRAGVEAQDDRSIGRIDVCDEGIGISPGDAPRIFEPFFTTKATGSGLGLAVVRRIVEAHRGEIEMRSEEGKGTAFILRLPLSAAVPSA
jgi:signal transduction histidine kinase